MELNDADRLKVRLLEYQEVCTYQRHEDTTKWTVIALTFGGAAALIGWAATNLPYFIGFAFLLAAALLWTGSRAYRQLQMGSRIRLSRAQAIEAELDMHNHEMIDAHDVRKGYEGELPYPGGLGPILMRASQAATVMLLVAGVLALLVAPAVAVFGSYLTRW